MWAEESGRASERVNESARAYTHFQLSMKYTTKLPNAKCKIRIMEIEFGVIITIICVLWLGVILIIQSHPFDAVEAYVCHLFGMWNALNVKWNVARVLWVCKIETTMNKHNNNNYVLDVKIDCDGHKMMQFEYTKCADILWMRHFELVATATTTIINWNWIKALHWKHHKPCWFFSSNRMMDGWIGGMVGVVVKEKTNEMQIKRKWNVKHTQIERLHSYMPKVAQWVWIPQCTLSQSTLSPMCRL